MTSIGPINSLLAEIRAQALARRRRRPGPGTLAVSDERSEAASETSQDWSAVIARSVAAIDPNDPQRHRRAFRAYLQAVLAKECGFLSSDVPGFQALVDEVQESMELDPRLQQAMNAAGRLLLDGTKE
jgi:hypothetical protein